MKRIALLLISALLLSGCSSSPESDTKRSVHSVFFVADTPRGFKLFSEEREFDKTDDLAQLVIAELISGELAPFDSDYTNLWGSSNSLRSITVSNSIATIDLSTISLNVGAETEQRAIEQIVWTYLTLNPKISSVRFTVNGEIVESFAGHVDTTGTFTLAPSYEVLNPLQISSINEGDVLSNPITVTGQACTFEANVVWKLSRNEEIVKESFTTAASACPDRSAWKVALGQLAAGSYKFEVLEYSAEDGALFAIDDKNFVVK